MDRVRTPYQRYAWLDPEQTFRVRLRWYPAPPGAEDFPGHHLFASGDWSEQGPDYDWPGPGEDKDSKREFYPGEGPRQHYAGSLPIGDPQWYKTGVPLHVIQAALRNPPGPPPDFRPVGYGYPAFVPCGIELVCNTSVSMAAAYPASIGGWRWGGQTKVCHLRTLSASRGGWKWGGSEPACMNRPRSLTGGGWRWGGSSLACRRTTRAAARGGSQWGGSTDWHVGRAVFQPLGGWQWGGSTTYCFPQTRAAARGGWKWGGTTAVTRSRPGDRPFTAAGGWKWGGSTVATFTAGPCDMADCCCDLPASGCPTLFAEFYGCTGAASVYNGIVVPLTSPDLCSRTPIHYTGSMGPVGGCPGFTFVWDCDHSVTPCQISITLQAGASCGYHGTLADPHTCSPTKEWDFGTLTQTAPMCCSGTVKLKVHS